MKSDGISIPIENSGRVASPSVTIDIDRSIANVLTDLKSGLAPSAEHYRFGADRTQVPPGTGYHGVTIPLSDLPQGEMLALSEGRRVLYIGGNVKYATGFGATDKLSFCFIYNSLHPNFDSCPVVTFADLQKIDRLIKGKESKTEK
jgi:hypothetical protein